MFNYIAARDLMKEKNISGKELAEKLGVEPKDVSRWLTGKVQPRNNRIESIAVELNVDPSVLMGAVSTDFYLEDVPTEMLLKELIKRMMTT